MLEASFVAAFLGGVLSLLSPCSALLLPAFFAYAFTSRTELASRTLLFLAGLCTVFIPLGLGVSLVAALLLDYRETTILIAGAILIGFGLLELLGGGCSFVPQRAWGRVQIGRSATSVYLTGLVYGISGFCAGPLLGAVLTVAGSSATPLLGASLLFTYALGTAAPLFLIAALWDRYDLGRRAWLRGREIRLGPWRTHTTSVVAGLLFIALGVSFVRFRGASELTGMYATVGLEELGFFLQDRVQKLAQHLAPGVVVLATLLVVIAAVFIRWRRKPVADATRRTGLVERTS